jgi:PRC-barrel domain
MEMAMLTRLLALALASGLAGPCWAQTAPGGFLTELPPGATRLSRMIGVDVIGSDIARLGEVKEVLVDAGGTVSGVVVATGGVLGIGARDVALPYGAFLWNYAAAPTDLPRSSSTGGDAAQARRADATAPGPAAPAEVTGTVGDPARPSEGLRPEGATTPVTGDGAPVRAVLRLTREDLRAAPAFENSR